MAKSPAEATLAISRIVEVVAAYQGPLPLPAHFEHYDRVLPGSAERILSMAEREQAHRHYVDRFNGFGSLALAFGGVMSAILVCLAIIGGIIYCAGQGWTPAVVALGGLGLVGIVTAFLNAPAVFGRRSEVAADAQAPRPHAKGPAKKAAKGAGRSH
ncbi:MAG: DUF2335 domain-containing protein [Azospirillaceae bacterium]|nr:DUF2335 domain-containing protein [Azospirillaceae bacterium]